MTTMTAHKRANIAKPQRLVNIPCTRCDGVGGNIRWPNFTCFRCGGFKVDPTIRDWAFPHGWDDNQCDQFLAKKEAQAQARRDKAEAKRRAEWEAKAPEREAERLRVEMEQASNRAYNLANCPNLVKFAAVAHIRNLPGFLHDIADQAEHFRLTDRQIEAFNRVFDKATGGAR